MSDYQIRGYCPECAEGPNIPDCQKCKDWLIHFIAAYRLGVAVSKLIPDFVDDMSGVTLDIVKVSDE